MIGGNAEMSGSALDHRQDRVQHSAHRADLLTVGVGCQGHGEIVAEQFVGPVNQVDIHAAAINPSAGDGIRFAEGVAEILHVAL